ncbi:hypothetical protein [Elizabethkingia occulta]|uniref:hypothetical protein n=1 Tax=Elizabethkingia occulta TaxID=1867263 RepID=UPI001054E50D|nr:hypothetical protein [Elizabethkingia occulta]
MDSGGFFCKVGTALLIVCCFHASFGQISPSRSKGEVFKHRPDSPSENLNYSGLVVVKKTMYGLVYEDKKLPQSVKDRIEKFFKRRLNGYTDLGSYGLRIWQRSGKWYIDNTEI